VNVGDIVLLRDFKGVDHSATVSRIDVQGFDADGVMLDVAMPTGVLDLVVNGHAPIPVKRSDEPQPMTWRMP
jgi:hypothetical protein